MGVCRERRRGACDCSTQLIEEVLSMPFVAIPMLETSDYLHEWWMMEAQYPTGGRGSADQPWEKAGEAHVLMSETEECL